MSNYLQVVGQHGWVGGEGMSQAQETALREPLERLGEKLVLTKIIVQ